MLLKLNVLERLALPSIMPDEGAFEDLIIRKELLVKLGFTQTDLEKYEIKQNGNNISWNEKGNEFMGFELTTLEGEYIKKELKRVNEQKKLKDSLLDVYKQVL